jgi:urease subunit gamma
MHLTPSEIEKLLLSVAGMIARDRLDRGVLLNHPETVALLSTWVIERAREGVAEMLADVQVEATFPDGRKLVTIHHPIA